MLAHPVSAVGPTGKPDRLTAVQHEEKFLARFPARRPVERFGGLGLACGTRRDALVPGLGNNWHLVCGFSGPVGLKVERMEAVA